jgi:hypothetical protein
MFEGRYRLVVAATLADEIALRRLKERSLFQGSLKSYAGTWVMTE